MENVVTVEIMRELDRHMIWDVGIPGSVLMENAASAVAKAILNSGRAGKVVIMIGPGNNGGDGLALLRILCTNNIDAAGLILCDPSKYSGDAAVNYRSAVNLALPLTYDTGELYRADVIIDAIYGTGLSRPVEGKPLEAIRIANACDAYRIAVDIPSGINGDTGKALGEAFSADETVTFLALKRGLLLTNERERVGRITVAKIGMTDTAHSAIASSEQLIDEDFVRKLLPPRRSVTSKGDYGRSLIIAGSSGMPGAAVLCSKACMRTGSGLTKAFVSDDAVSSFSSIPEVMVCPDSLFDVQALIAWASAVGIGPGLGNDPQKRSKLHEVLKIGKNAVIDADGLNTLDDELKSMLGANCVLTPHPGEMARMTGKTVAEIVSDPVGIASDYSKRYGCVVLLKNAVSVIASPDSRIRYNSAGNPGLAKGGSGDVLTGIITALLAQGIDPFDAASAGAFILGQSAEKAFELLRERMLCAGDVISALGSL